MAHGGTDWDGMGQLGGQVRSAGVIGTGLDGLGQNWPAFDWLVHDGTDMSGHVQSGWDKANYNSLGHGETCSDRLTQVWDRLGQL